MPVLFHQHYCWLDRLLPSAKEAISKPVLGGFALGLNITHVNWIF